MKGSLFSMLTSVRLRIEPSACSVKTVILLLSTDPASRVVWLTASEEITIEAKNTRIKCTKLNSLFTVISLLTYLLHGAESFLRS